VFTVHLSIVTFATGGNSGNCGCFGSLLPMTPIEAIVKNLVAIFLLVVLLFLLMKKTDVLVGFWKILSITLASVLALFMITFSQPQTTESENIEVNLVDTQKDTINEVLENKVLENKEIVSEIIAATKTTPIATPKPVESTTPSVKSGYAKYFSNIDKGEKIICFFVPGCEHCRSTATEINQLKANNKNFPEISILFMDEEANLIPEFFSATGASHPYKIIDIIGFWKILGANKDVPGVKLLKDGKEIKYFYGITDNQFSGADLMKLLQK
jgi:thiol-disulfide isomerase/thioredoxin